jgi:hypothetical protein
MFATTIDTALGCANGVTVNGAGNTTSVGRRPIVHTTDVIGIVIAAAIVVAFAAVAVRGMQRRRLRDRFGDEYQRVVDEKGRGAAESELRRRERGHARLDLREVTEPERTRFRDRWVAVQARFVADPIAAVRDADSLVGELVAARGYPTTDHDELVDHLSVGHADVLGHYRDAHAISVRNDAGTATTEQLRQALVHYRELFAALLGDQPVKREPVAPAESGGARSDAFARDGGATAADRAGDVRATTPDSTDVDEPDNGAAVGDTVRAGTRGRASSDDASAPHTDATRRDTPPHGR